MRRQRRTRGTTVFVVMLVITLLTALGLFAVRSASLSNMSSGFNRQLTQTHYITDYAITSMVAQLGRDPVSMTTIMKQGDQTGCTAYAAQINPTCALFGYTDLELFAQKDNTTATLLVPRGAGGDVHGSLGHAPVEADMRIELTDYHTLATVAGNDTSQSTMTYAMVTITATGMVRPQQLTPGVWDTNAATAASVAQSRAHVIVGPVPR